MTLNISRKRWAATLAGVAAVVVASVTPGPAMAAESGSETYGGYTQDSFVAAAVEEGTSAAVAEAAWGDIDQMSRIAVESTISQPSESAALELAPRAVFANYTATCTYTRTNVFGGLLQKLEMVKKTQSRPAPYSPTLIPTGLQLYGTGGNTWYYAGETGANDYYSGSSHVSYRQGLFSTSPNVENENRYVRITQNTNGSYSCAKG